MTCETNWVAASTSGRIRQGVRVSDSSAMLSFPSLAVVRNPKTFARLSSGCGYTWTDLSALYIPGCEVSCRRRAEPRGTNTPRN